MWKRELDYSLSDERPECCWPICHQTAGRRHFNMLTATAIHQKTAITVGNIIVIIMLCQAEDARQVSERAD